jgi:transcriptional regulator with XRE-family HTH domain
MLSELNNHVKHAKHFLSNNVKMTEQFKIERIKEALTLAKKNTGISSDKKMAERYGLTRSAISLWKSTGQIDFRNITELSKDSGLSESWIEKGALPKLKTPAPKSNANDAVLNDQLDISGLISVATPNTKKLLEELSVAIDSGQITEDEMNDLMAIAKRLIDKKHL